MKLVYGFHSQLRSAMQWHEDMREISKLDESTKEIVARAIRFATTLKGPEVKVFLTDLSEAIDPWRRIDNEYTVENEAILLTNELKQSQRKFEQLSLFSQEYLEDLRDRTATAQHRAEQVRLAREREIEENRKAVLLPFPSASSEGKPKNKSNDLWRQIDAGFEGVAKDAALSIRKATGQAHNLTCLQQNPGLITLLLCHKRLPPGLHLLIAKGIAKG